MIRAEAPLAEALRQRQQSGLYRTRLCLETPQGPEIRIAGHDYLAFCSNDYLGLANHPDVVAALASGARRYGVGSGASHLVCGHSHVHHELEEALARLTGRPRALLFSSGYMANIGVLSALMGKGDIIFQDRLNHASLLDGSRLSGARMRRFPHTDTGVLSRWLDRGPPGTHRLIASDGIFSMDGDLCPLPELVRLARTHGAWLMIDDAHAFGVTGKNGGGSCALWGASMADVPIVIGTLGKAFGTSGAFVAGSDALIDTLIQHARSYIYTTAIPPAIAYATLASLELMHKEPWRRTQVSALASQLHQGAKALGLSVPPLPENGIHTPIIPIFTGTVDKAMTMSQALLRQGILVTPIRPPTVPRGTARLRITLSASHSSEQVTHLLEALATCQ